MRETRPPLLFRIAKQMQRRRIRGWHRVLTAVERWGLLERDVVFNIAPGVPCVVPMHLNFGYKFFDQHLLDHYEEELIAMLAAKAAALPAPVTLVDCGADIGVLSARLAVRSPAVQRIVAFEPNPSVSRYLARNLAALRVPSEVHGDALSDFNGKGTLREPAESSSFHARFLEPADDGVIPVRTLDSFALDLPGGLILKIDVEGGEAGVIAGAPETLRRAPAFVVALEANPDVFRRTGIDPMECVRRIRELRDCRVTVSEHRDVSLDLDRNFFEQHPTDEILNLVCCSV